MFFKRFLLDEFIISAADGKVNCSIVSFTICLQAPDFFGFSFIKYSKNTVTLYIDGTEKMCYI